MTFNQVDSICVIILVRLSLPLKNCLGIWAWADWQAGKHFLSTAYWLKRKPQLCPGRSACQTGWGPQIHGSSVPTETLAPYMVSPIKPCSNWQHWTWSIFDHVFMASLESCDPHGLISGWLISPIWDSQDTLQPAAQSLRLRLLSTIRNFEKVRERFFKCYAIFLIRVFL